MSFNPVRCIVLFSTLFLFACTPPEKDPWPPDSLGMSTRIAVPDTNAPPVVKVVPPPDTVVPAPPVLLTADVKSINANGRIVHNGPHGDLNSFVIVRDSAMENFTVSSFAYSVFDHWQTRGVGQSYALGILGCDSNSVWAIECSWQDGSGNEYADITCFSGGQTERYPVYFRREEIGPPTPKEKEEVRLAIDTLVAQHHLEGLTMANTPYLWPGDDDEGLAIVVCTSWKQNVCWFMSHKTQMCWYDNDWYVLVAKQPGN